MARMSEAQCVEIGRNRARLTAGETRTWLPPTLTGNQRVTLEKYHLDTAALMLAMKLRAVDGETAGDMLDAYLSQLSALTGMSSMKSDWRDMVEKANAYVELYLGLANLPVNVQATDLGKLFANRCGLTEQASLFNQVGFSFMRRVLADSELIKEAQRG
jgi:hypothetical protein